MARKWACIAFILLAGASAVAQDVQQLIRQGHWKRARPVIEAAYAAKPNDALVLYQMSRMKQVFGELDAAKALAEKAVAAGPTADNHLQLADVTGDLASKASMFKQMAMAGAIKRELAAALAADPNHVRAHYFQFQFYKEAPGIAGGGMDKARAEATTVAKLDAAWGYIAQADLAAKEKRTAEVPEFYHKAHDAKPAQYETAFQWCNSLVAQKKWAESEKCAQGLLAVDPGRVQAYSILAFDYVSEQRWDDAEKTLVEGEKVIPDNLAPYFNAGNAAIGVGAYDRAEKYFRKYLSQEPEPNAPKLSRAHWRLGAGYEKWGKKPEAVKELQIATQMEPEFKPAQEDLKRLR